ncbi:GGDEF domain-containing protein [Anoxynatronum buryatiense]|uniref:Diguanylate cyclase (GGDEF) domain-containing protein n=1 Tax=Anoxynatronum buryatiense TaxID=489973 RepID=A0AA45WX00_9CLOT|nr:GGDEF domain-containing protein [Anoxynatronum buryatiense]SMP62492.1 diguanylate cyclase (GGDEF) domain-containing protein [Anoxynatronum buryatiense]
MPTQKKFIHHQLFRITLLYCIGVAVISMAGNLAAGLPMNLNIKWLVLLTCSLLALVFRRKIRHKTRLHTAFFLILILYFTPMGFIESGGSANNALGYVMLAAVLIGYIFRGRRRVVLFLLLLAVFQGLLILEYSYPQFIGQHAAFAIFMDRIIQTPVILGSMFLVVRHYTQAYEETHQQLEQAMITDKLTGLYNRSKTEEVLEMEMERYRRSGNAFSIIMIDVDHFKTINDTFGHPVGDEVLVQFAWLMKSNVRKLDTTGRWGGEEFMVILPETVLSQAGQVGEKIRHAIEQDLQVEDRQVTVSAGVAVVQSADTVPSLVNRADQALYQAKDAGRNQVMPSIRPKSPDLTGAETGIGTISIK